MDKRIGLFGCQRSTEFLLGALWYDGIKIGALITIPPEMGHRAEVVDYADLRCRGVSCYTMKNYALKDPDDQRLIADLRLDLAFVAGWQRLIPASVLASIPGGVYGMHGSADDLPIGRGRSPLNWALIEQRKWFTTNLFRYDPGVDSGAIVGGITFSIQPGDTAMTLRYKNILAMRYLIRQNLDRLLSGRADLQEQRSLPATYYPRRYPEDSQIDWNADIQQVDALIRAVACPFNGAFSYLGGRRFTIWQAAIFETDLVDLGDYKKELWGTIVEVFPSGDFLVNCRGGLLLVQDFSHQPWPKRGMRLESLDADPFPLNCYGYHDQADPSVCRGSRP